MLSAKDEARLRQFESSIYRRAHRGPGDRNRFWAEYHRQHNALVRKWEKQGHRLAEKEESRLEFLEEVADADAIHRQRNEPTISWEEVRARLGLDTKRSGKAKRAKKTR